MAVNREIIVESALEGMATPVWSSLVPSLAGHNEELERRFKEMYPFDIEKARGVLEDDGWTRGSDGIFSKDGRKLETSIWVINDPIEIRVAEMIQSFVGQMGMRLEIVIVDAARMAQDTPQGLHDSLIWRYNQPDPEILSMVFRPGFRMHFERIELYEILNNARGAVLMEDRIPYYEQAQVFLNEELPWVPLYCPDVIFAFSSRVDNIKTNPFIGSVILNDLELRQ